jgi:hypothetical protein
MNRALLLTIAIALGATAASADAATWSAPASISQPHTFAGDVDLAVRADHVLVAGWAWQDNVGDDAVGGWATATRPQLSTAFDPERPAIDGLVALAPFANAQTIALGTQAIPHQVGRARISAQVSGGATRSLAVANLWRQPALGAAPGQLTALVAYVETTRTATGALRRIVRTIDRRNGAWAAPSTISGRGRANAIAAAVGPRGDAVVVFERNAQLLARLRRPGHNWGSIQTLATATTASRTTWVPQAAIDARGRVRVAWRRHPYRGVTALESRVVAVGRNTFAPRETLAPDGASASFVLRATPAGFAVADVEGDRPALHRATGGTAFSAVLYAAPATGGARGADVAANADGSLTVAWIQPLAGQGGDGQARAATTTADATAFGAVEDASPPEAAHEVRLASDGSRLTAVYAARPTLQPPSVIRATTRTP